MKNGMYKEDGNTSWYHADTLHRLDGPAIEWQAGTTEWYAMGNRHREDGPAFEMPNGHKEWYVRGRRHRDNAPAVEKPNGSTEWWSNDRLHRQGGPAIEDADGHKEGWVNGKQHREDGPAIIDAQGNEHYFLNGTNISKDEFTRIISAKNFTISNEEKVDRLAFAIASLGDDEMSQVMRVASRMKAMRAEAPPSLESIAQAPQVASIPVVEAPAQEASPTFMQGLRKELRESSDGSLSMTAAYGIKDMITHGVGLKKNKFLKLGTAAGAVALIAATPAAPGVATGAVVLGTIMTIAAAIHTTVVAANYTGGLLANKIKEAFSKPDPEVSAKNEDSLNVVPVKSQNQVMASIGRLRADLMNAEKDFHKGFGFAASNPKR